MTITFVDESGATIAYERVRAGLLVVRTEYDHNARALVCTVKRGS
jgi:hypothetical protein